MDVTIVIPVKNGGSLLDKVLGKIFSQKTTYEYEVICVDSGSKDNSIEIINKYPCALYQIPASEFGHGKTRNFGASKGTGDFIIFITQDAIPCNDDWLQNFIDGMKEDSNIAGGFGRHVPYPDCNILDKRDITNHFKGFGLKNTIFKLNDKERYMVDEGYRHFLSFFSDNNSCLRRSVWEKIPYDDVNFAEDQIWARKILELGYKKLYCPEATVYHSHNYKLRTYSGRYYDEYKALYDLHGYVMIGNSSMILKTYISFLKRDIRYILSSNIKNKIYWLYYSFIRNYCRCQSGYIGGKYHLLNKKTQLFLDQWKSQQFQQINGHNIGFFRKVTNSEFWKWIFLNPDRRGDSNFQSLKSNENKTDVCSFYNFILKTEISSFSKTDYEKSKNSSIILNWIIPEMGVCSGGHINIFRFVKNLQKLGFCNKIYINKQVKFHSDDDAKQFLVDNYEFDDNSIEIHVDISDMKFAHGTIATSWDTAYTLRDFNNTISKFYFVQDFEPYFYPQGSTYVFAENTYKMGFRGLTAGDWLKNKLEIEYGMKTDSFSFSYDRNLYKAGIKRDNKKRVFFYARPVTPRRDFELGLLALDILCRRVPDVEVCFAGWDVSNYKINFNHANFGNVKLTELSDLYSQCDLCLVISNTNLSLLPLEIMASNSVAVCSKGDNSTWLVNENNSILVDYTPEDIADKIEYYLKNPEKLCLLRQNGLKFAEGTSWDREAEKVKIAIERGLVEDEKNISSRW